MGEVGKGYQKVKKDEKKRKNFNTKKLSETTALWPILMCIKYYYCLYEITPKRKKEYKIVILRQNDHNHKECLH